MKHRLSSVLLALIVIVAMLAGCTAPVAPQPAGQAASTGVTAASTGKTKVNWLMISEWPGTDTVAADFMADNPDIDLVLEKVAFNDLFQQIQTR